MSKRYVEYECTYCGHTWKPKPTMFVPVMSHSCPKCGDKNLYQREYETVDYYEEQKGRKK